jgi:hypothetical protein
VVPRQGEPDGEDATDGARAEHGDRERHASAGSVIRFTTFRSE